jgi:hypothetical protein
MKCQSCEIARRLPQDLAVKYDVTVEVAQSHY